MLSKVGALARIVRSASKINYAAGSRFMSGYGEEGKSIAELASENKMTMNDLPVPEGDWQEDYNKTQTQYNMYLLGSTVLLMVTLVGMKQTGCFTFYDLPNLKSIEVDSTKLEEEE